MPLTSEILEKCPKEWTSLDDAEKQMPPQRPELRSKLLEQMEIDGLIEVMLFGNPPCVEIRKTPLTEDGA